MNPDSLKKILRGVRKGECSVSEATNELRHLPFEDLKIARIDHHRSLRTGLPEVILGESKTAEQIVEIMGGMAQKKTNILVTRVDPLKATVIKSHFLKSKYCPESRTLTLIHKKLAKKGKGLILVVTAGTSDIPVAQEAVITAKILGHTVKTLFDVGVAGIHRLLASTRELARASVIIVVAGMEGALPSVVGGLVGKPIIAVPTSVGYGASFGGITALLGMMNACAPGVMVVNIDNGFGAAVAATFINRT